MLLQQLIEHQMSTIQIKKMKNSINKAILTILFFFGVCVVAKGQEDIPRILPPSPEAAAFAQYGDVPVSEYTGVPNVSVPIYNIQTGGYSLPISLSYHASGIKVGQEASWVGLGWTLNAHGTITRQTRGLDDFGPLGYYVYEDVPSPHDYEGVVNRMLQVHELDYYYKMDGEPDLFIFNFAGYSGKFIFNNNGEVVFLDQTNNNIKIDLTLTYGDATWEVTTPDGVVYRFDVAEEMKNYTWSEVDPISTRSLDDYIEEFDWANDERVSSSNSYESAWYLTQIELTNGQLINFNYTNYSGYTRSFVNTAARVDMLQGYYDTIDSYEDSPEFPHDFNIYHSIAVKDPEESHFQISPHGANVSLPRITYSVNDVIKGVLLESISWENGVYILDFNSSGREDLNYEKHKPNKLDNIELVDNAKGEIVKRFVFETSYFNHDKLGIVNSNGTKIDYLYLRLKLDGFYEQSITDPNDKIKYSFTYLTDILPKKNSADFDHWGYYNEAGNDNKELAKRFLPNGTSNYAHDFCMGFISKSPPYNFRERSYESPAHLMSWEGENSTVKTQTFTTTNYGDRNSTISSLDGILKSIIYPTGGSTNFEYELHGKTETVYEDKNFYHKVVELNEGVDCGGYNSSDTEGVPPQEKIFWVDTEGLQIELYYEAWSSIVSTEVPSYDTYKNCCYLDGVCPPVCTEDGLYFGALERIDENGNVLEVIKYFDYEQILAAEDGDICKGEGAVYSSRSLNPDFLKFNLLLGYYRLRIDVTDWYYGEAHVMYKETVESQQFVPRGGSRIKKITSEDLITNFKYDDFLQIVNQSNFRTTHRILQSNYLGESSDKLPIFDNHLDMDRIGKLGVYMSLSSTSTSPLSSMFTGAPFGYGKVTKYKINSAADTSKTVKTFINYRDLTFHFLPNKSNFSNGKLLTLQEFKNDILVRKTENSYHHDYLDNDTVFALKFLSNRELLYYTYISKWMYLNKETTTVWELDGNNPYTTIKNFHYANHDYKQLTSTTTKNSKNQTIEVEYYYPYDVPNLVNNELVSRKIVSPVVKKEVFNTTLGEQLSGSQTTYGYLVGNTLYTEGTIPSTSLLLPKSIEQWEPNIGYVSKVHFDNYDPERGNTLQFHKKFDGNTSFMWGYDNNYPVIKALNLSNNSLQTAVNEALPTEAQNLEELLDSVGDMTTQTQRDLWITFNKTLRGHWLVENAQITTYTYKPLIGITSQTDARGVVTRYEYDGFGRLIKVSDQNGKIIKQLEYNYKQ
jgi:YD repeat-containing protein